MLPGTCVRHPPTRASAFADDQPGGHLKSLADQPFIPVVLGTDINCYGIARSLNQAYGLKTLSLGRRASRETAASRIVEVRASQEFEDEGVVVETVLALADEFPGKKLLVIPTVEAYTNAVLAQRDKFGEQFLFPIPTPEVAARVYKKADFYATCDAYEVPYPSFKTLVREDLDSPDFEEELDVRFPVIAKPSNTDLYPRLEFDGHMKVFLVHDAAELRTTLRRVYDAGYTDKFVVQEYMHGDESVICSISTYSDRHGKMKLAVAGQVTLTSKAPKLIGNNDAIVTTSKPELVEMVEELLNGVGYTGSANFDLMYDVSSDKYRVLEMNLRQGASSYYATLAGANIPAAYVRDLVLGQELDRLVTQDQKLWSTVPRIIAWLYSAPKLRGLVWKAARNGHANTLWYLPDLSFKRAMNVLRVLARQTYLTMRFSRSGINSWSHLK